MKEAMYQDLSKQYHGTKCIILNKASLSDPRFKSLPFLKPEEKDYIAAAIVKETINLISPLTESTNDNTDASCSVPSLNDLVENACFLRF